jgi:hypothetical protein
LAVDLVASGWWLCYVPRLVVHHHPSERRDASSRRWHILRNAIWSAWLRRPLPSALRKSGQLLGAAPCTRETWRGLTATFVRLPWILRERRPVPAEVEGYFRLLERPQRKTVLDTANACSSIETSKATACRAARSASPTTTAPA